VLQAGSIVLELLTKFTSLVVCGPIGKELNSEIRKSIDVLVTDLNKPLTTDELLAINDIAKKAKEFETVLTAELETLATYNATQKGIYSTADLIEQAENVLPVSVLEKISQDVVQEIRESGRCLAFDNPTASGFHIMRATELVIHEYYKAICSPTTPDTRLGNWGAYLAELRKFGDPDNKGGDPEVKKVVAILQQIKDSDRNLIMHPEIVLTPDDAFTLFEVAKGAIMTMANKLPGIEKQNVLLLPLRKL
jgi:hypothetical protein